MLNNLIINQFTRVYNYVTLYKIERADYANNVLSSS